MKKKKVYNTTPNLRQKIAFKNVVENGRSVSRAMRDAGYSPKTAVDPSKLTKSKSWKQLMDQYLPESLLAQEHKKLLQHKMLDYFTFPKMMKNDEIKANVESNGLKLISIRESEKGRMAFYSIDDANAKSKGIDMAYKLRGSYASEKLELNANGSIIYLPGKKKK
jgi:hypothetical protein